MFAVAIFCTYAVQFYVPMEIIWPRIERHLSPGLWAQKYGEYILRASFVVITCKYHFTAVTSKYYFHVCVICHNF